MYGSTLPTGTYKLSSGTGPTWMRAPVDMTAAVERERSSSSSVGSRVIQALERSPQELASQELWNSCRREEACLKETLNADDHGNALPVAAIYIIVRISAGKVTSLYIGQAFDVMARTLQTSSRTSFRCHPHRLTLIPNWCTVCYRVGAADTVMHFPLFTFEQEDKAARSFAVALWCHLLGTYQQKSDPLAIRRDYGLPNIGDRVLGANCEYTSGSQRHCDFDALTDRLLCSHPLL